MAFKEDLSIFIPNIVPLYLPQDIWSQGHTDEESLSKFIENTFKKFTFGKVIVEVSSRKRNNEQYFVAWVHLENWIDTPETIKFQRDVLTANSRGGKIFFYEDRFWFCKENRLNHIRTQDKKIIDLQNEVNRLKAIQEEDRDSILRQAKVINQMNAQLMTYKRRLDIDSADWDIKIPLVYPPPGVNLTWDDPVYSTPVTNSSLANW